jgi:hypothetical protein
MGLELTSPAEANLEAALSEALIGAAEFALDEQLLASFQALRLLATNRAVPSPVRILLGVLGVILISASVGSLLAAPGVAGSIHPRGRDTTSAMPGSSVAISEGTATTYPRWVVPDAFC